jgi:2-amino-4-hydroxy-6-hydroxymethyldihydropteridine diphosphokinase
MKAAPQNYAIVALGSNMGDSISIIEEAAERLNELTDSPLLRSSVWKTLPIDCPPGSPPFLNSIVAFIPRLVETPESLLKRLQSIEKEFGRKTRTVPNEPRPLDLDLVTFQTELRRDPRLTLPHPRARERAFVLEPLAEVLPWLVLPGQEFTVTELLQSLSPEARSGARKLQGGTQKERPWY